MYGPGGPPMLSIAQYPSKRKRELGGHSFPSISRSRTCSRSSHFRSYSRVISSVGCIRSGTITVTQPAARPARIPLKLSSSTRQSSGASRSFCAASRKVSGAGLLCATSVPETTSWKYRAVPVVCRFISIILRGLELATMRGIPRSSSAVSSSLSPFLQGTPSAKRVSASCQTLASSFFGSPGM